MLRYEVKVLAHTGSCVGLSASTIVNDLVTSNNKNPWLALSALHKTELYHDMWFREMWMATRGQLYSMCCQQLGIEGKELKQWNFPELNQVEKVAKVFEVYRLLTKEATSAPVLDDIFVKFGIYQYLLEKDKQGELIGRHSINIAEELEQHFINDLKFNDHRIKLMELYEETPLEKFFKESGAIIVED